MRAVVVEQGLDHALDLRVLARRDGPEVDALEHERAQLDHRFADPLALDDLAGLVRVLDEVVDERVDPPLTGVAEDLDRLRRQVGRRDHAGAHGVVDVVVDVGDAVHQPDDPALERRRLGRPPGVADDPVADRLRQVEPLAVALERVDDPQRVLVVLELAPEAARRQRSSASSPMWPNGG